MAATINTTKYTIENDLTKKEKKKRKKTFIVTSSLSCSVSETLVENR